MNKFLKISVLVAIISFLAMPTTSFSWPLPDTGQTKCYNNTEEIACPQPGEDFYGQDGNYLINEPSYTKLDANGNDLPDDAAKWIMVRDNVTGLIWEVKTDDGSIHDRYSTYDWNNALSSFIEQVNTSRLGGFNDWRLPTVYELGSIIDLSTKDISINTFFFPNTRGDDYWTATPRAGSSIHSWRVHFRAGYVGWGTRSNQMFVRCVRGEMPDPAIRFVDNGDGTIADLLTGLMWQSGTASETYTWSEALSYAADLRLAKYNDWRIPNIKELQQIVRYQRDLPATYTDFFLDTRSDAYWTGGTYQNALFTYDNGWYIDFSRGSIDWYMKKSSTNYVRCVRGGQARLLNHLFILSPRQGSAWQQGDQMLISWEPQSITGNVQISISRQGGKVGTFEVIEETINNNGTYLWTVTGPESFNCVLKIEPFNDPSKATMQGLFTITELPKCNECNNDPVVLQNIIFGPETACECSANISITIGPNVTIENAAKIVFKAPKIDLADDVHIKPGSIVNMQRE